MPDRSTWFRISQAGQIFPLIIKKSKFIASASPISSRIDANQFLEKIRDQQRKANHHCYAYRILEKGGILQKEDDDGEPSGTAGQPILYVLEKQQIINTIIIVSRYFGGIKLGKGGLVRAYSKATTNLIKIIGLESVNEVST